MVLFRFQPPYMNFIEKLKLHLRAKKYETKYDIGGVAFMKSTIKKGQTVLDIGAHKGGYSYLIDKWVGKQGKIVAFEPQTILYNYLSGIKKNFKWNNLVVEHMALSDIETLTTLFIPTNHIDKESAPGATILNNRVRDDIGFTEEVATDTLDHYCAEHHLQPDFLKIDVEGNELNIFKGGIETLKKYKPSIIVECDAGYVGRDHVSETFRLLTSIGYRGSFIDDVISRPLNEFDFDTYQDHSNGRFFCNNFTFEAR